MHDVHVQYKQHSFASHYLLVIVSIYGRCLQPCSFLFLLSLSMFVLFVSLHFVHVFQSLYQRLDSFAVLFHSSIWILSTSLHTLSQVLLLCFRKLHKHWHKLLLLWLVGLFNVVSYGRCRRRRRLRNRCHRFTLCHSSLSRCVDVCWLFVQIFLI